jgi:hypothetical protein
LDVARAVVVGDADECEQAGLDLRDRASVDAHRGGPHPLNDGTHLPGHPG